jgi:hypothetical protein
MMGLLGLGAAALERYAVIREPDCSNSYVKDHTLRAVTENRRHLRALCASGVSQTKPSEDALLSTTAAEAVEGRCSKATRLLYGAPASEADSGKWERVVKS